MSLMRTLAKVAMGVAAAKGMSSMTRTRRRRGGMGGVGGLLAGVAGGAALNHVMSGRHRGSPGLGGLLEGLGGAGRMGGSGGGIGGAMSGSGMTGRGGGLDGLLGGLLGGGAATGGSGALLSQIAGRAPRPRGEPAAPFGQVLNSQFDDEATPLDPTPEQEAAAGLMLRAMIQAARADGHIDGDERARLMEHLDSLDPDEQRLIQAELEAPVDPEGLAREVPEGLEAQTYAMSLMAIDLDTRAEAEHLHKLATALRLDRAQVDQIHEQVGAPSLYES